jgi:hypothetical protein
VILFASFMFIKAGHVMYIADHMLCNKLLDTAVTSPPGPTCPIDRLSMSDTVHGTGSLCVCMIVTPSSDVLVYFMA